MSSAARRVQDPAGLYPLLAQPGRASHQRPRLPGTGSRQDEQRATVMGDRLVLFLVEPVQRARHFEHEDESSQKIPS
jgi:hypothetical protein